MLPISNFLSHVTNKHQPADSNRDYVMLCMVQVALKAMAVALYGLGPTLMCALPWRTCAACLYESHAAAWSQPVQAWGIRIPLHITSVQTHRHTATHSCNTHGYRHAIHMPLISIPQVPQPDHGDIFLPCAHSYKISWLGLSCLGA